jgi:hypothetical protein
MLGLKAKLEKVESSRRRRPIGQRASSIALENQRAEAVYISGATGSFASIVNGVFNPTQMIGVDGRLIYVKRNQDDVILEHVDGHWRVKPSNTKNTPSFYAMLEGNNALLDCSSHQWTLADGRGGSMAPTRQIILISEQQYIHETEEEETQRRRQQRAAAKAERIRQIEEAAEAQRRQRAEAAAASQRQQRLIEEAAAAAAAAADAQRRREGEEAAAAAAAADAQRRREVEAAAAAAAAAAALLPAEVVVEDDRPVQVDPLVVADENSRAVTVLISGATGKYRDNINGIFEPSSERGADGRVIYAKNDDPQTILEHFEGVWDIKPRQSRNTDSTYA